MKQIKFKPLKLNNVGKNILTYFWVFVIPLVFSAAVSAAEEPKSESSPKVVKLKPRIHMQSFDENKDFDWNQIQAFFKRNRVLNTEQEVSCAPKVVEVSAGVTGGNDVQTKIFVKGLNCAKNSRNLSIFSSPISIKHPFQKKEVLGYEIAPVAQAAVLDCNAERAELVITAASEPVEKNYVLFAQDEYLVENRHLKAAELKKPGLILSNFEGGYAKLDSVLVDFGRQDGVKVGHWLEVYRTEYLAKQKLSPKKIGKLLVYRVFDKVSYALILNASEPLAYLDEVRAP
ncbi:MAG: hypothetical protein ACKOAD_02765 [Gammaproteobacteria bacterium]